MSMYCFTERPFELWKESSIRGWLAAVLDFPHTRTTLDEYEYTALLAAADLRPDVCCVTSDFLYSQLVVSAWVSAYRGSELATERLIASSKAALHTLPKDAQLRALRESFTSSRIDAVQSAYAQFVAKRDGSLSTSG